MALTQSVNSKANVKKITTQDVPFSPLFPVVNRTTPASTTLGQTVFNLNFSVDTINNPDSTFVVIDGKTLSPGSTNDFQFTAINQQGFSSQITLNAGAPALPAGLNWFAYKLGVRKEAEFNLDNRFVQLYAAQNAGFQPFVDTTLVRTATATTGSPAAGTFQSSITNRASIVDISQDLKGSFGDDRVLVQQLVALQNEFGPNGEKVFAVANDDRGLMRFVGNSWVATPDAQGTRATTTVSGAYAEITFYGTGITLLGLLYGSPLSLTYQVDGATASTLVSAVPYSSILTSRGYSQNQKLPVISGLTLGVHTVRINNNATQQFDIYGFDVLNNSSNTSININPGVAYVAGQKLTNSAAVALPYNTTFESGTLGTRGGHVVVYQKSDGTFGKAVTPTNASSAFLTSADHTNEEIIRNFHFREFASNRSDDFSAPYANSLTKAFTLDDDTTTLLGSVINFYAPNAIGNTQEVIHHTNTGSYITFTFVGTGLDILFIGSTGISDAHTINIDGTNISTTFTQAALLTSTVKIASGLPYGTHVCKITRNASPNYGLSPVNFIVYQPKKPAIPSGAIEIEDYNLVANYVANATQSDTNIPTGVIRKHSVREIAYVGTFIAGSVDTTIIGGFQFGTSTNADYVQYTFFGTGFSYRYQPAGAVDVIQATLDGSTNFSAFTTSGYGTGFSTFVASTGVLTTTSTSSPNNGLEVSGLTLGIHTIRFTKTSGSATFYTACLDVITPIYSAKSNSSYDVQNTALIGSCSMSDNRKFSPIKDAYLQKKNISQAFGVIASPTTTSTVPVPVPDMSVIHTSLTGRVRVVYSISGYGTSTVQGAFVALFMDGQRAATDKPFGSGAQEYPSVDYQIINVGIGSTHNYEVYWYVTGASIVGRNGRNITVEDV
jgi:hypothetical protein